ncbi:hypothetical protein [Acidaminococcus timonensis]|uniref:hypothetical protein n=1 Tax=Acidaminococcus timonensis TaxID=1871002 RepID=UPI003A5BB162
MTMKTEHALQECLNYVKEKLNGRQPESPEEVEALINEYMQQYQDIRTSQPRIALTPENAQNVYDWLELAENARTKKEERQYLENARKLDPKNLDVLVQLMLLDSRKKSFQLLKELENLLVIGKKDLQERKLYKESMGDFYLVLETRPYMRALSMYIGTLKDNFMIQKAISVAKEMLKLNKMDNLGARYDLMALYVYTEDEFNARKLMRQFPDEKESGWFQLPMALLYYRLEKWDEAQKLIEALKKEYKATTFKEFITEKAGSLNFVRDEGTDYYEPYTRSELESIYESNLFLWLPSVNFFEWVKEVLKPAKKKTAVKK